MMSKPTPCLLTIYDLERGADPPVSTDRVARRLDRPPAATTEVIRRLETEQLVDREPHEGVRLTAAGRRTAAACYGEFETLCRLFEEVLDVDAPRRDAALLAGVVSPTVVSRLDETIIPSGSTVEPSN